MISSYLKSLENIFSKNSNPDNARFMKKYMKDKFEFFGIQTTRRRELTGQFLKESKGNDWGVFVGETSGYSICDGSWQDVHRAMLNHSPYVDCEVHQAISLEESRERFKELMNQA